eukprot:EG_transcript_2641
MLGGVEAYLPYRVLVTGGWGYLGRAVCSQLLECGYSVRIFDHFSLTKGVPRGGNPRLECVKGEVGCTEELRAALVDVQAVVHLAAVASEAKCRENPEHAIATNVTACETLATLCQELGVERLVFTSSTAIYDDVPDAGVVDEAATRLAPKSLYGQTKLQAERVLMERLGPGAKQAGKDCCLVILRLPLLYGPSTAMRFDTVVNGMTISAFQTGMLHMNGGSQWRPLLSTVDAASAIALAIMSPTDLVRHQTFNVGENCQNLKVMHIAQSVSRISDAVVEVLIGTGQSGYRVNFDKIHNILGFAATKSLDESIRAIGEALVRGDIRPSRTSPRAPWGFHVYQACRFCGADGTVHVLMDLGATPLANSVLQDAPKPGQPRPSAVEYLFPLRLAFCTSCAMLHLPTVVPTGDFNRLSDYTASEIPSQRAFFEGYAAEAAAALRRPDAAPAPPAPLVVEIGCNDGVFLVPLRQRLPRHFRVLGVDSSRSAEKLTGSGFDVLRTTFDHTSARNIAEQHGKAVAVFAINPLLYLEDIHSVLQGVRLLLADGGLFVMQLPYVGSMLRFTQFDWISHENTMNCSLLSFSRLLVPHGMEVFDVTFLPNVSGGSVRFHIQHLTAAKRPVAAAVGVLRRQEQQQCLHTLGPYRAFVRRVDHHRETLLALLHRLKAEGKVIVGYGASGRATILCSYYRVDQDIISYFIDDGPSKQGKLTPGNHLHILQPDLLYTHPAPDYVVLFAWTYADAILKQHQRYLQSGGKFIVPLPQVRVVAHQPARL